MENSIGLKTNGSLVLEPIVTKSPVKANKEME